MKLPHKYSSRIISSPDHYATITVDGVGELRSATPVDFDGPGDAWSPGDLLLAAVEGCFLFTFRAIAKASKLDFVMLEIAAEGVVDRHEGTTRFTAIVLRPRLTLPVGVDATRALRILEKSERGCLVANSLATPITLEPTIVTA
jgi:uncharacterized OsmC-like protein